MTNDPDTIAYNITQLGTTLQEKFGSTIVENNEAGSIGHKGKFIFSFSVSLEDKEYFMVLIDLRNDEQKAIEMASTYGVATWQYNKFMSVFYELSELYDSLPDDVELIQGKPPQE